MTATKIRRWIHAKVVCRGFWDLSCDICYFHWPVWGQVRDALASELAHQRDYHGGVDYSDCPVLHSLCPLGPADAVPGPRLSLSEPGVSLCPIGPEPSTSCGERFGIRSGGFRGLVRARPRSE